MRMLFDDLVGAGKDRRRDCEAERLRSLEIDDEIEFYWLLDRQVAGLGTLQDLVDVARSSSEIVRDIRAIGHQPAVVCKFALGIDRRQARLIDEGNDLPM